MSLLQFGVRASCVDFAALRVITAEIKTPLYVAVKRGFLWSLLSQTLCYCLRVWQVGVLDSGNCVQHLIQGFARAHSLAGLARVRMVVAADIDRLALRRFQFSHDSCFIVA